MTRSSDFQLPPGVRERLLAKANKVVEESAADMGEELREQADLFARKTVEGDIVRMRQAAYSIKSNAAGFGWPLIAAVARKCCDMLDKASSDEDRQHIGLGFLKSFLLLSNEDFKGREELLDGVMQQVEADLKDRGIASP